MGRDSLGGHDDQADQDKEPCQLRRHREQGRIGIGRSLVHVRGVEMERNGRDLETESGEEEDDGKCGGGCQGTDAFGKPGVNHLEIRGPRRAIEEAQAKQEDRRGEDTQVEILGRRFPPSSVRRPTKRTM